MQEQDNRKEEVAAIQVRSQIGPISTAVDINQESATKLSALCRFAPLGSPENDIDDENVTYEQIRTMTDDHIPIYAQVTLINQDDDECGRIRDVLEKDSLQIFEGINLRHYTQRYSTFCYKDHLWVPDSLKLLLDIIQGSHDPPACGNQRGDRTLELIKRQFYRLGMKETVARFVCNCRTYQGAKPQKIGIIDFCKHWLSRNSAGRTSQWTYHWVANLGRL